MMFLLLYNPFLIFPKFLFIFFRQISMSVSFILSFTFLSISFFSLDKSLYLFQACSCNFYFLFSQYSVDCSLRSS